jgi:tripeptide aminopeptidase
MINDVRLITEFCKLVSIDAPSFGERKMADQLKEHLIELGFQVTEDDAGKNYGSDCGNIYGYLEGTIEGEPILFSAHMDTVTPAIGKKAIVHPDGKITSDGTTVLGADDVSGIISILEALRCIKENNTPHRTIEVLFTIAEEVYSKGSIVFDYNKLKSKEAYALDISGPVGRAAYKAPTILAFEVKINGRASHAGFAPEKGIHAIAIAAQAISKLSLGKIDEETTANIGTIEGGEATNIVPETCIIKGEVRSFSHERAVEYLKNIETIFADTTKEHGATHTWSEFCACRAYETDKSHVVIERYKKACEDIGIDAELVKSFGGSDHNSFALHGITGIVLANAMNLVHSCQEYTEIDELVRCTQIVKKLMISDI